MHNAIDLVADSVLAIHAELTSKTTNAKALQSLLHGTLLAAVNVGPLEIGRVFLDKERRATLDPQPADADIAELVQLMAAFSRKLAIALAANARNLDPEQKPLQDELTNAYRTFNETITRLCLNA